MFVSETHIPCGDVAFLKFFLAAFLFFAVLQYLEFSNAPLFIPYQFRMNLTQVIFTALLINKNLIPSSYIPYTLCHWTSENWDENLYLVTWRSPFKNDWLQRQITCSPFHTPFHKNQNELPQTRVCLEQSQTKSRLSAAENPVTCDIMIPEGSVYGAWGRSLPVTNILYLNSNGGTSNVMDLWGKIPAH